MEDQPKQLRNESYKLQDRNLEIYNVVTFLGSTKNRMLKIYGEHKSGRKSIVSFSINKVLYWNRNPFIDGVFWVDLKEVEMSSVITEINQ